MWWMDLRLCPKNTWVPGYWEELLIRSKNFSPQFQGAGCCQQLYGSPADVYPQPGIYEQDRISCPQTSEPRKLQRNRHVSLRGVKFQVIFPGSETRQIRWIRVPVTGVLCWGLNKSPAQANHLGLRDRRLVLWNQIVEVWERSSSRKTGQGWSLWGMEALLRAGDVRTLRWL